MTLDQLVTLIVVAVFLILLASTIVLAALVLKLVVSTRKRRLKNYSFLRRAKKNAWARNILPFLLLALPIIYYTQHGLNLQYANRDLTKTDKIESIFPNFSIFPENKDQAIAAFNYVNQLRQQTGRNKLTWDERAYALAITRSKDMFERNYFDHVTPEGTCAKDLKAQYGFASHENLAENLGGMTHYRSGVPVIGTTITEAVNGWMYSRGHRFNLLYQDHVSGAIGCYNSICTFYGVNSKLYGLGAGNKCTTGAERLKYWETAPPEPGEVELR